LPFLHLILIGIIILSTSGTTSEASPDTYVKDVLVDVDTVVKIAQIAPTPEILEPVLTLVEPKEKLSGDLSLPFYSQFRDITSSKWQKVGCGIASLAMVMDYYTQEKIPSVDTLLSEGIEKGAYLSNAGWTYKGLISVASKYGFTGESYDFAGLGPEKAFAHFKESLQDGPVIASVHYKLDPTNPIPHLVVVNGVEGDTVYYSDPADKSGGESISIDKFKKAWKKRYIAIHPNSLLKL